MDVSIVASANRVKWWERFYNSLAKNACDWEVIFVGDIKPEFTLPDNFKWIQATVKPCQCYQIGFWASKGQVIHWSADDASYGNNATLCDTPLDLAFNKWKDIESKHGNDGKTVIAMNPCEDGGYPQAKFHRFFGGCLWSPVMAPFGLIPRHYLVDEGQGYSKSCVSGQAENDVVMRILAEGGRVEMCLESKLYVHHRQCHPRNPHTGKEANQFRKWYPADRKAIEEAWVLEGYGSYEKFTPEQLENVVHISPTRLKPLDCYENTLDICSVSQGNPGQW